MLSPKWEMYVKEKVEGERGQRKGESKVKSYLLDMTCQVIINI